MAVSQAQIVDLLYKEAFGVTKTDTATNKSPSNESIPSPTLIRGDTQWTQSDQIPATAAALAGVIQAYTGASAVQTVADTTTVPIGGIYPTWKTNLIYWIPSEFGATYNVQVWVDSPGVANPTSTGTQIFADGSGGTGQYYYNYQSGVLNFIGETIPAALTSGKVLYIVGYRYIGLVGVTNLPSDTTIGNLNINGTTIISTTANSNIILTPDGSGIVQVSSGLTSNANITATFFIGNGSQLTGVAASNAVSAGTVTASAQPNITSVGTLVSLDVTGNITAGNANLGNLVTANFFSGSGNLLSNIQGSNVTGNVTSAVTANFANYAGNVTVNSQPNITSVGTLTSLEVSGNGSFGNISTTGNITGANVVSANTLSGNLIASTANINGNLISLNANLGNAASANFFLGDGGFLTNVAAGNSVTAGTVTASSQPNITSVGTLVSLDITGNLNAGNANLGNLVTANFFSGSGNLLSNIQGSNVTGNVTSAVTANFANFAGNITVNSQPNITSVGTLTSLDITGNLAAGNANLGNAVTANYFIGSGNNLSNIQGSNITGNVTTAVTANFANYAGNVTVNSQPNITSVGTLTSLTVTGNVAGGNLTTVGVVVATGNGTFGNISTTGSGGNISGVNNVSANTFTGTLTTNAQPNITSVGTLVSLAITGNITAGNANLGNLVIANYFSGAGNNLSNIQGSNVTGNVTSAVTANFANYAGNVTVAGQANITSVGTLTSLNVSGNANTGNLGTNNFIATGTGSFSGNVNLNTNWINNVGYPNLSTDAASKAYVDTMVSSGIAYHQPVLAATTTTLAIATGGTTAYNSPNGAANGIGAYISTTGTYLNIDGANVQTVGTRILVKNEANAAWNGIYTYANTTAIVRATDADEYGSDSTEQLSINDFFFTSGGVVNEGIGFIVSAPAGTITFGTSNITFAIFTTSQVYDAGTGINITGTTISISNTTVTTGSYGNGDTVATFTVNGQGQLTAAANVAITANAANLTGTTLNSSVVTSSLTSVGTLISLAVTGNTTSGNVYANSGTIGANLLTGTLTTNAQPNVTSVGTLTGLNVNGNITAANITANTGVFTGNGSGLTAVAGGNISGQVANALVAGTVYTNAQPNITSVGTLTSLSVTGNLSAGNISTGNISAGVGTGGNITGANLISANYFTGTLTTNAQPNITSVGTLTSITVSGTSNLGPVGNVTITGGTSGYYLQTNGSGTLTWAAIPTGTGISNGTSNVNIPVINGNITLSVGGNANIVTVTGTGINVAGTANINGNVSATNANLGNATTANYFIGNLYGTANLATFATTANSVAGANVSGQVGNALVAGTVYTNAQPNITSTGTLSSLTVTGNITGGNVYANTGTIGANLLTGTLTTNAQPNITSTGTLSSLTVTGNITGGNVYANTGTIGANLLTGTLTTNAQPNVTSVGTLTTLAVTGNVSTGNINAGSGAGGSITGGNLVSANYITGTLTTNAQPNITSIGTLTSLDVSGHLVANTFQMGYGIYAFYSTSVYFATTASTSNNQVLWSYTAADLSAIDFTIIATDATGSTRQTCKISAAILGTTVAFNEYGGLYINGGVGSFSVVYNGSGPTPTLELVVTPDSSNLTEYNMLISKYLV